MLVCLAVASEVLLLWHSLCLDIQSLSIPNLLSLVKDSWLFSGLWDLLPSAVWGCNFLWLGSSQWSWFSVSCDVWGLEWCGQLHFAERLTSLLKSWFKNEFAHWYRSKKPMTLPSDITTHLHNSSGLGCVNRSCPVFCHL